MKHLKTFGFGLYRGDYGRSLDSSPVTDRTIGTCQRREMFGFGLYKTLMYGSRFGFKR